MSILLVYFICMLENKLKWLNLQKLYRNYQFITFSLNYRKLNSYFESIMSFNILVLLTVALSLSQIYSLTVYDTPTILISQSDVSQVEVINQNIYFVLKRASNSTIFIPYSNSIAQNYYTYLGNGSLSNMRLSKSKKFLYMISENQTSITLLRWSITKEKFQQVMNLTSEVLELITLKINQINFYLIVGYKNGNIDVFVENNETLTYKSNFKFEFFSQNFKMKATKDGKTICVIYAYGELFNMSYQIYFFTINSQGIFQFIASNNFTIPTIESPIVQPKISMTWSNFSAVQLSQKQIVFSTQNHKGIYFRAYLEPIGSQNDYVLQISEIINDFEGIKGLVPSLSYEHDQYDIFTDSSISTLSYNGVNRLLQNNTIVFLQFASTYNYIILGFSSQVNVYIYVVPKQLDFFGILMSYLTGSYAQVVLSSILSTPSGRQALNYFQSLFFNIDDFWLFMYHDRKYGYTLTSIFDCARVAQNQKWKVYGVDNELSLLQDVQQQLHNYYNYDFWTHKTFLALQDRSQALISNTVEFFLLNLPFSIIIFGIFRIIYCITCRFSIGKFFKRYSFTGYLLIIISEGNLQYFSYLCSNQLRMLFFFNIVNKMVIIFTIICFFFVIFACVGMFMLLKYLYGKNICQILDCEKGNEKFIFWVTYQFGIRNVMLGFAHAMLNELYYYQMGVIMLIDSLSIVYIYVLFVDSEAYFAGNWQFLMKMLNYCIRILLYVSLVIEKIMKVQQGDLQNNEAARLIELFDFIQQKIVLLIMLSWILSFFAEILPKKLVRPKKKLKNFKKRKAIQNRGSSTTHSMKISVKNQLETNQNDPDSLQKFATTIPNFNQEMQILTLDEKSIKNQQQKQNNKFNQTKSVTKKELKQNNQLNQIKPVTKKEVKWNKSTKILVDNQIGRLNDLKLQKQTGEQEEVQINQVLNLDQFRKKIDRLMF